MHRSRTLSAFVVALVLLTLTLASPAPTHSQGDRTQGLTADDLVQMNRLSDPQVSPDGKTVVYVLRTTDMEADRGRTDLWMLSLAGGQEGEPVRLTSHEASDGSPRFAPDGKGVYFLSGRSGSSQVWYLPLSGGEARQVTDLPMGVGNLVVSPTGDHVAFTLDTFVDCDTIACSVERLEQEEAGKTSGVVYDSLLFRHWDTWADGRRSRLYAAPLREDGTAGEAVLVSRAIADGTTGDVPSKPFGGAEEIAFTPDGEGLVFAARTGDSEESWSTDFDLYWASVTGNAPPRLLTGDNDAWDTAPLFSPDGKTLVYLAMERPGYEADRFRVMVRPWGPGGPAGPARELAPTWDRSPGGLAFTPDGKTLLATAGDVGNVGLFTLDLASGKVTTLRSDGHARSPQMAGDKLVYALDTLTRPVDLYVADRDGSNPRRITDVNAERLAGIEMGEYEQFSFAGWNGETVYGYAVKPVGFEAGRKYPLAFLIHGGPQGSFGNDFHYRWNPQTYAAAGYAAVMIDFHGSTGYGQAFTDSIRDDWGGKPLEDLRKGLAAAGKKYPWIDTSNACALGASYGGYMINWIAGRWSDGFRCLVNHDGLFDHRMMYYSTEELWFPEWDHMGPYYASPEAHEKHNPVHHVENWKTPMLVIHGELDYRVPLTQGLATFTALQRRGVPSRFLYFPDENHWVLRPANSVLWHETVLDWLASWLKHP
jgi:dipeptidyl aminopeptidase/acylaminoacyl peptidase